MTQQQSLNLVDVVPGTRLVTHAGDCVEVVENPQDGTWLICRHVAPGTAPDAAATGAIEPIFAQDIAGLA